MDYKSPIEIYTGELILKEMDDGVMRATVNCGVHVDKEELLKALAYDRGQYEKGYRDATAEHQRPPGKWIEEIGDCEGKAVRYICSNCGDDDGWINYNFCPICGADMRGEKE